jgi:hypothetical protein
VRRFPSLIFEREKKNHRAEIHRHLVEEYGEVIMNEWCSLFNGEVQVCTMKRDLDASVSSPTGLLLPFVKTGY